MQINTESKDPIGAAIPIGNSVFVKYSDASHENGILAKIIEIKLWINDIFDKAYAQKYPLKLKCIPAKIQSQI